MELYDFYLPRVTVAWDVSPCSFKLKSGFLPPLIKLVS